MMQMIYCDGGFEISLQNCGFSRLGAGALAFDHGCGRC